MPQVDAWVVEKSLELLARMRRDHDPSFEFEVNLSGHSIGNPDIERAIVGSLATHGVDPAALILEITETAAVADVALARTFAERMTELGCALRARRLRRRVRLVLLPQAPALRLREDRRRVRGPRRTSPPVDRTIMRSIVGIARDLGKRTVAEFVSEPEILQVCRDEGVDFAQGYLIGKPVPFDQFVLEFMPSAIGSAAND